MKQKFNYMQQAKILLPKVLEVLSKEIHKNAVRKGFWPKGYNLGEKLCLVHSEISEALEALRDETKPDKHCPEFSNFEIELADAVIRIMDIAAEKKVRLGEAIIAKHAANLKRPVKHGRKF